MISRSKAIILVGFCQSVQNFTTSLNFRLRLELHAFTNLQNIFKQQTALVLSRAVTDCVCFTLDTLKNVAHFVSLLQKINIEEFK